MTISVDWKNKIIESTESILDLPLFHSTLRDLEDDISGGGIYPVTHTWRALNLGSGAYFYQADLINGYSLKFPNAGNYIIKGNLIGSIIPVSEVYIERQTSASYITTAVGGSGPSAEDIAAQIVSTSQLTPVKATIEAESIWAIPITGNFEPGSIGEYISKKLLSVAKFIGLK